MCWPRRGNSGGLWLSEEKKLMWQGGEKVKAPSHLASQLIFVTSVFKIVV